MLEIGHVWGQTSAANPHRSGPDIRAPQAILFEEESEKPIAPSYAHLLIRVGTLPQKIARFQFWPLPPW
jgi:hypothetical protein